MRMLPDTELAFRNEYWLKEDLILVAKELGISTVGSKIELIDSIAAFKYHGITLARSRGTSPRSQKGKVMDLDSTINTPYSNDEEHRAFFLEVIGAQFKFNVTFMNWMKKNQGVSTYRDAVSVWKKIEEDKKSGRKLAIGTQFEFNKYTRDFFLNNPGRSREDCVACWSYKKSKPGTHRYEESDLLFLENMNG